MGDQSTSSGLVRGGLTREKVLKDIASRQIQKPTKSVCDDLFKEV